MKTDKELDKMRDNLFIGTIIGFFISFVLWGSFNLSMLSVVIVLGIGEFFLKKTYGVE